MTEDDREEVLPGGIDNAGRVVRIGPHVLRPAKPYTPAVHQMLRHVRAAGFDGVPEPVGIDPDGRERVVYIPGDVPLPPYPEWAQSDVALASTTRLLRGLHDAVAGFVAAPDAGWNLELADPEGGPIACHNDVCPENVVFRDGIAVALLDFDFAAPGRRLHDLSQLAKMCVPLDTADDAARLGRRPFDPFGRLRIVADAYGLPPDRSALLDVIGESMRRSRTGGFVAERVQRGEPAFIAMWNEMGGVARYERRYEWFEANRDRFARALG
jgi:hypothetical protein